MSEQQKDFQPPVELPKPQPEQSHNGTESGMKQRSGEVPQAQAVEQGISLSPQMSAPSPLPQAQPAATNTPAGSPYDPAGVAAMPPIADDVDLIEKEWVNKAKAIVEKTKDDPYSQNKQMTEVKVDYLKKRYNKEVKLTED